MRSEASDVIARFVVGTRDEVVLSLADGLAEGAVTAGSSSVGLLALPAMDSSGAERAVQMLRAVRDGTTEQTLAAALRVATAVRTQERLGRPEIEIAWTGPAAEGPLVRPTLAVMEEMLSSVREAGEILLVGYAVNVDKRSPVQRIVDLLGEAALRRAVITVILHSDEEGRNHAALLGAWNKRAVKPRMLTWDPPPGSPYTKLHAKALVVDRLEALVTSANLSYHGLGSNLELGLRVRGPQAAAIARRFDHLIASGTLRTWTPTT